MFVCVCDTHVCVCACVREFSRQGKRTRSSGDVLYLRSTTFESKRKKEKKKVRLFRLSSVD